MRKCRKDTVVSLKAILINIIFNFIEMKKKFFFGVAFMAVAACAFGLRLYNQTSDTALTPLQMQNLEALTSTETGSGMSCTYNIEYTGGYSMPLYCPTCSWKYGYVATGSYGTCP